MNYLFYGTKDFYIDEEVKKIKQSFTDINISQYDFKNDQNFNFLDDAITISMFEEKKLIIVDNATFFIEKGYDLKRLENYLTNPNTDTTIIFLIHNETIDKRRKIYKLLKEKGKIIEFNDDKSLTNFVKENFEDYKIDNNLINLLIQRCGKNPNLLKEEIQNIKLYKDDDKQINKDDIINLTHKNVQGDIFTLTDYIISNKKDEALELYHKMLEKGEEPINILGFLASTVRIMYSSKELLKQGYTENMVAEELEVHPYRVKLGLKNGRKYDNKILLKYLNDFADLDYNIKSGIIDKNNAIDMFILSK